MIFNNSIIDNAFIFPNFDFESISYSDYQNSTIDLKSEFDFDIFRPFLQNPKPEFIIEPRNTKRGRPSKVNKKKREHSSSSTDNIISKIQTHYLTFIVSFLNDSVKEFYQYQKYKFSNFIHEEKSKVSFDYLESMKNSTIRDLITKMHISTKYKCCKDNNINILKQLEQIPFFESLFKIKYLDLFPKYYNNKQPLRELLIEDARIPFSHKTKSFSELLRKKYNLKLKGNLIGAAENFYLNDNTISNSGSTDEDI